MKSGVLTGFQFQLTEEIISQLIFLEKSNKVVGEVIFINVRHVDPVLKQHGCIVSHAVLVSESVLLVQRCDL